MLRSCCRPVERCFGQRSLVDGLLWHENLKPHSSGDFSLAVAQANRTLEDQAQVCSTPFATYVGVYDGHGGPEASRFILSHLFPYLNRFTLEQGKLSEEVIRRAFRAVEDDFANVVTNLWRSRPRIASVGSCCLVGAITSEDLYVANLGDSRAVLGRLDADRRTITAERLTDDHNVAEEKVRKELRQRHPDDPGIVLPTQGVWRLKGIIQVSRSIGDVYLKNPEICNHPLLRQFVGPINLTKPVMSADPSIAVRRLNLHDSFVIFASDGLWEQLSDQTAVEIVFKNRRAGIAKRLVLAAQEEAARKREMRYEDLREVKRGVRRHFHDDIAVVVIFLDRNPKKVAVGGAVDCFTPADVFSLNSEPTV